MIGTRPEEVHLEHKELVQQMIRDVKQANNLDDIKTIMILIILEVYGA